MRGPLTFLGFRGLSPIDVWVALALVQQIFDDQDPNNYARFLYREPLGIDPPQRASVLVVEGLNDSLVPNHATRSWVRELGPIPQLGEPGREIFGFERDRRRGVRKYRCANDRGVLPIRAEWAWKVSSRHRDVMILRSRRAARGRGITVRRALKNR